MCYWHEKGILAYLETYGETRMNNIHVLFNWKPNEGTDPYDMHLSGSRGPIFGKYDEGRSDWDSGVIGFSVALDGRDGLKYQLERHFNNGTFFPRWKVPPFLWLCNYNESKENDHNMSGYNHDNPPYVVANRRKLAQFPKAVLEAMFSENVNGRDQNNVL